MFSDFLKNSKLDFNKIKDLIERNFDEEKFLNVLLKAERERLNFDDLIILLNNKKLKFLDKVMSCASKISFQRHGKVIKFYAPLYVSNECVNKCKYCGFNTNNKIVRKTLSIEEVILEAKKIKESNIDNILIVAGETPKVSLEYLLDVVKNISDLFSTISIEVAPLKKDEYEKLFEEGVDGVISYQETYDSYAYEKYHIGPKANLEYRLNTHDKSGSANMRILGIGALLGLSNPFTELYFLATHARYLEKKYWRSNISISFPRIRPSESGFMPEYKISDEELLYMIAITRLFLPDVNLILSTRESENLRDRAVFAGITQISAGSKTNPLGYSKEGTEGKQFEIFDKRSSYEISQKLSSFGLDPVFKDWDKGFRK